MEHHLEIVCKMLESSGDGCIIHLVVAEHFRT